jgi:signal transduction histidine kinase
MAVSHDLKTPLTSIEGYLEAINDGLAKDEETLARYLGIIGDKAHMLEGRILELIDFVKMETGEWQLKAETIDAEGFFSSLCAAFSDDAQVLKRNLACRIEIPAGTVIAGDPSLLTRVLENLFNNAVRYTDEDDSIEIKTRCAAGIMYVEVRDTGPGIDEHEMPLVFDPFFRGTRTRNEQGFGLGLSIVKSIVQAHGFSISAESNSGPDSGTRFIISIPLEAHQ